MNIFYLSADPMEAAQLLCDKHVVKMTLESAQLLSTTMSCFGVAAPYRPTHVNHPSALWVRASSAHYRWLLRHFQALCYEYKHRYQKTHRCEQLLTLFTGFWLSWPGPDLPFMPPPQVMPPECQRLSSTVAAYQAYYQTKPAWVLRYRLRPVPEFLQAKLAEAERFDDSCLLPT
jgi:hypothetical protein